MRTLNLLSGVGVAIVAAWLAVTNLAYADEFTCVIPATGDTDCGLNSIAIPARGVVTIYVDSIKKGGEDLKEPATFRILDTNKNNEEVASLTVSAGTSSRWIYPSNLRLLVANIRVNHGRWREVVVRGRYTIM
jgi:hypothetical protein